jgi:putative transposase
VEIVGIDLGIKDIAATSDGDKLTGHFYRLHRAAARRRKDALHKFSRKIVNEYQTIKIGDVSSLKLARTRMAKSVLDSGWGMLKAQLQYKGQQAGRSVIIVSEKDSTRTCSSCKALTGVTHDQDVNSARNHLSAGRSPPSVSGNMSSLAVAEPSLTCGQYAAISELQAAA